MVSEKTSFAYKDSIVKTVGGSCSSYNIIYVFECRLCCKLYVGRSTRHLRTRVGEHRRSFYKLCDLKDFDEDSDEYALGLHLFSDHNLKNRDDFDNKNCDRFFVSAAAYFPSNANKPPYHNDNDIHRTVLQ